MTRCVDFFEVLIKSCSFDLWRFGKWTVLVPSDAKSGGRNKIGNVNLESRSQTSKETGRIEIWVAAEQNVRGGRIQSNLQADKIESKM